MRILPITEDQLDMAKSLEAELRRHGVRAELEYSHDKLQGRILKAEEAKVHTMLIIGAKEQEADSVAVRVHGKGNRGVHPREKVVKDLLEKIFVPLKMDRRLIDRHRSSACFAWSCLQPS